MTASTVTFDASGLGEWTDDEVFEVTADRIAAYAAATNDPIERHRQGEIAPPVFAVVPVFMSMAPAALAVAPVELLMKLVHGEQDFHFHRPIYPGDTLVARAKPIGFQGMSNGSTVTIYAETRSDAGELVNEQWMTAFFRKVDAGPALGSRRRATSSTMLCVRRRRWRRCASTSTPTRRFGTRLPRVIPCRSTSMRRSPRCPGCPGSSTTGCARWRSPPGPR